MDEKEHAVNEALQCVQRDDSLFHGHFDHIFVDEGQDLYGNNWPKLLEKMHKSSVRSDERAALKDVEMVSAGLRRSAADKCKWVLLGDVRHQPALVLL